MHAAYYNTHTLSFFSYNLANPALRTAVEMALMAVRSEFSNIVRLPVAPVTLRCSCNTKRVSVIVSTSTSGSAAIASSLIILATSCVWKICSTCFCLRCGEEIQGCIYIRAAFSWWAWPNLHFDACAKYLAVTYLCTTPKTVVYVYVSDEREKQVVMEQPYGNRPTANLLYFIL